MTYNPKLHLSAQKVTAGNSRIQGKFCNFGWNRHYVGCLEFSARIKCTTVANQHRYSLFSEIDIDFLKNDYMFA